MKVEIRQLEVKDESAFLEGLAKEPRGNPAPFAQLWPKAQDFADFVDILNSARKGQRVPKGHVPCTSFYSFNQQGEIMGRVSVRHCLNDFLSTIGGHIGFVVLPEYRGKGVAKAQLRRALIFAKRELQLEKAYLTCDEGNLASQRCIESFCGEFFGHYEDSSLLVPKRRYWVPTLSG